MSKKLTRKLTKEILKFVPQLEDLVCQKYRYGRCRDLAGCNSGILCASCQIREAALLLKSGAEKFNPHEKLEF